MEESEGMTFLARGHLPVLWPLQRTLAFYSTWKGSRKEGRDRHSRLRMTEDDHFQSEGYLLFCAANVS